MMFCLDIFYAGQLLFVDKDVQKSEIMAYHPFNIRRRVLPSRFIGDICLVNCDVREYVSGDLRSGYVMISAEGCL